MLWLDSRQIGETKKNADKSEKKFRKYKGGRKTSFIQFRVITARKLM